MSRANQQKVQIWVDRQELEKWKSAFGERNMSMWVRRLVNEHLEGARVSTVAETCEAPVFSSSPSRQEIVVTPQGDTIRPVEVSRTRFDPKCRNAPYHWKGACKFCGGS